MYKNMRNKKRTATVMTIPDSITEREFKKLLEEWWNRGGYEQIQINATNTATDYSQYRDDLPAYAIEQWYRMDWNKQLKICRESGSPEKWISRVMGLSIKSNSSPFHSQYRKFSLKSREQFDATTTLAPLWHQEEPTDYSEDLCVRCMKMEIEKLDFYEKMLVESIAYKGIKPKKFAEEHNLDTVSVTNNFYSIKKKLKKACQYYR